MNNNLVIATVTALLKRRLENELGENGVLAFLGGDATVSARPPERVAAGSEEPAQLNLFLYMVTPNTSLRPEHGTAHNAPRRKPFPLDLHYLLTAYGSQDYQSEVLLGTAAQVLQQADTLSNQQIAQILGSLSTAGVPPPFLKNPHDTSHIEQISIHPQFLNSEELSRLWSALQARYQLSLAFRVAVFVRADE